jgi:hypothetical protein
MRRSGFEPEFMAWQATVITTTLSAHSGSEILLGEYTI